MSGFGLFLSALLGGTKVVGRAIENKKMKDYSYKINEKGQATWLDFDGNQYVNGEKLVGKLERKQDGQLYRLEVGQRSGKVYMDPYENKTLRIEKENLERKNRSKEYGHLVYEKYYMEYQCALSTEIETDKIITCIYGSDTKKIYRKWYLGRDKPSKYLMHPKEDSDDFGVPITKEEYEKFKLGINHTFYTYPLNGIDSKLGTEEDPYYDVEAKKQINL